MLMVPGIRTDAEGRFGDLVSFPDTHVLHASEMEMPNVPIRGQKRGPPRFGQVYRPLAVTVPEGQTTECTVALGPAALARVSVMDGEGTPVAGATIVAVSREAPHPLQLFDCARTDERGKAEYIGLGEGSWRLHCYKKGAGVASVDLPELKWGEEKDLLVKLGPSGDLFVAFRLGWTGEEDLEAITKVMGEIIDERGRLVSAGPIVPTEWGFKSVDDLPHSTVDPAFIVSGAYAPGRYRVVVRSPRPMHGSTQEFVRDLIEASEEVAVEAGKEARVRVTLPAPQAR
jgi:hypothetical protein